MAKGNSIAALMALLVMAISVVVMVGWLNPTSQIMHMLPGPVSMVFNSALCFFLSSISLLLYISSPSKGGILRMLPSLAVLTMAIIVLAQYAFSLPFSIDELFSTHWMVDSHPNPGRMAQSTSIGFVLVSSIFLLVPYARNRVIATYVQVAIFIIMLFGLISLAGYFLNLEYLYGWYQHTRIAVITAVSFVLISGGIAAAWSNTGAYLNLYRHNEDKKILMISGVILIAIAFVAGLAGFSTSTRQNEDVLKRYLNTTLKNRINLFEAALNKPLSEIDDVKKNSIILSALKKGVMTPAIEQAITKVLFTQSYNYFRLSDSNGKILYQNGTEQKYKTHQFKVRTRYPAELSWSDGFHLRVKTNIEVAGKRIGELVAEWPLDLANQLISTEKFFVCGFGEIHNLICLPKTKALLGNTNIFLIKADQEKLLHAALYGRNATIRGSDTNKDLVMAVIKPVSALNLSFVYKEKADSLYKPLQDQLETALLLMITAIVLGVSLLYWQVLPLIRQVIASEKKANSSSSRLKAILQHASEGIITIDEGNCIETSNEAAEGIFEYQRDELIGKNFSDLLVINEQYSGNLTELFTRRRVKHKKDKSIDVSAYKKNGLVFPLEMSSTTVYINDQKKMVIIMRDISERKIAEEKLQESEVLFRLAFHSAASGVAMVALDGRWIRVNAALCRITGYTEQEMLNMRFQDISNEEDNIKAEERQRKMLAGDVIDDDIEKRYRRKDGKIIWVSISVALVRGKNGQPLYYVTTTQEVTDKKEEEQVLSYHAYYDALTGLANRVQLEQNLDVSIASALRNQKNFAVFFLDLDRFKEVNDTLGHDVGDELLKVVAGRLKTTIRMTDIASRLGGDEFVLILNGVNSPQAAASYAEKIMAIISKVITINGKDLTVGVSVGISFFPNDGLDGATLLKSADLALYRSKELGRNNYQFCTNEMNSEITDRTKFKVALRQALENGELSLDYFPKLQVSTQTIEAVEALLRWRSDHYGNVSPARMIPVAEESGLIVPLSEWVINKACTQAKKWQIQGGNKMTIAVNVAKRQFMHNMFSKIVQSALQSSSLAPQDLELEISESLLMTDPDYSLKMIESLKNIGVQITMDNFGTGYSSLVYLHRYSVDRIKIDRSLIRLMAESSEHAMLVSAIISLARNLGVRVAAEGVESKQQYDLLIEYGCDEIQGYLISPPLGAEKIEMMMGRKLEIL